MLLTFSRQVALIVHQRIFDMPSADSVTRSRGRHSGKARTVGRPRSVTDSEGQWSNMQLGWEDTGGERNTVMLTRDLKRLEFTVAAVAAAVAAAMSLAGRTPSDDQWRDAVEVRAETLKPD